MNFKPLDIVDRLKYIRQKYNIKQKELDCEYLNKKVYSYIETRRRELSEKTLEKILKRFNEVLKEKNINQVITRKEVEISVEKQVAEYIEMTTKNNQIEVLEELEQLLEKYPSNKGRGLVYKSFGDIENENKNYSEAIKNYILANNYFVIVSDYNNLSETLYQLTRCYYFLGLKEELKNIYKNFNRYFEKLEKKEYIFYNIALGFYQCKEYQNALELLENINFFLNDEIEFKIFLLKNICLENLGDFHKSERKYIEYLEKETNEKNKKLLLTNLIENYRKQKEFNKIKNYMVDYIKILNLFSEEENQNAYWLLGRLFRDLDENISAKLYYLRGILIGVNIGKEYFDSENYYIMLEEYIEICETYDEVIEVEKIYNETIKVIFNLRTRFVFVKKYLELDKVEDVKRIISI
ncbi:MAG: helix-turn-helix transcriptional regulator [Cetobacterium sp.]|uniref:helix-turn-helix domain-containing protein n=1 Tax=Cetobacterium sp. TaxID=2071632 RepID=UPI002FC809F7